MDASPAGEFEENYLGPCVDSGEEVVAHGHSPGDVDSKTETTVGAGFARA